jgi:SAM-dependent methyltransferase
MKRLLRYAYRKSSGVAPFLYYAELYRRFSRRVRSERGERDERFKRFLVAAEGKQGLQIGVKENAGRKFGPNWTSVDLYDTREFIDYNYDVQDLKFDDEMFDAAVCWSILEHVPYPQKAISELLRVLKPGGQIWVQLPFLYPYHDRTDYWRASPDGLRVWMAQFEEVASGCDFYTRTKLVAASYFHGIKPHRPENERRDPPDRSQETPPPLAG